LRRTWDDTVQSHLVYASRESCAVFWSGTNGAVWFSLSPVVATECEQSVLVEVR